jgi:putative ATPase
MVSPRRAKNTPPPGHITNAPAAGMEQHGKGVGYKYPHDYPGNIVRQQYRPSAIALHVYYEPGTEGFEKEVKRRLDAARKVLLSS